MCVRAFVRAFVHSCVRACAPSCVRSCVRARVCGERGEQEQSQREQTSSNFLHASSNALELTEDSSQRAAHATSVPVCHLWAYKSIAHIFDSPPRRLNDARRRSSVDAARHLPRLNYTTLHL
eukprot:2155941-Pleurochrysis_carterae.AAC.1